MVQLRLGTIPLRARPNRQIDRQQVIERMSAKDENTPDQIVIFVDELNKYASTDVP